MASLLAFHISSGVVRWNSDLELALDFFADFLITFFAMIIEPFWLINIMPFKDSVLNLFCSFIDGWVGRATLGSLRSINFHCLTSTGRRSCCGGGCLRR